MEEGEEEEEGDDYSSCAWRAPKNHRAILDPRPGWDAERSRAEQRFHSARSPGIELASPPQNLQHPNGKNTFPSSNTAAQAIVVLGGGRDGRRQKVAGREGRKEGERKGVAFILWEMKLT